MSDEGEPGLYEGSAPGARPAAPDPPKRRGVALRAALGALLALLFAEVVVRQYSFAPTDFHPAFGRVLAAGATVRWAGEGFGTGRWTVQGIRRAAPPDFAAPSIVALGDSFTEGKNIDDDEVYTHRLEAILRDRGRPIQVLNFGRSYLSAPDYVGLADYLEDLCHQRWTIVQVAELDLTVEAWDTKKRDFAHFRRGKDGRIRAVMQKPMPPGRLRRALDPVIRNVALYMYGVQRVREFATAAEAEPPLFSAGSAKPAGASSKGSEMSEEKNRLLNEALETLHRAYHGRLTFLFLADFDPRAPSRPKQVEAVFDAACEKNGWSCVNLRQSYEGFAARRVAPYGFANTGYNVGHLNAGGHAAAAELLAREMERLSAHGLL